MLMSIPILLLVALLGFVPPLFIRSTHVAWRVSFVWSSAVLALGAWVGVGAFLAPAPADGLWLIDYPAALLVLLVSFVQWTAMLTSRSYLAEELRHGIIDASQVRRYLSLLPLFVFAMLTASVANNLGVQWIALEATTLATTLLVALYARDGSLEAAWKYLILCSTGIALGLAGFLVAYYAGTLAGIHEGLAAMNWTVLREAAPTFSPALLKIAFVLALVGYGTKAGLVPMHTWLPDAHSSAPSPVSGMLSGVLLPVALVAVLRFKTLVDASLGGDEWSSTLLIVFGLLSIAVPAAFTLVQTDYKRLLAYSSIEHMGIATLSFGFGGVAAAVGFVHLVGHALAKSALFFGAGNIVTRFHSTKFSRVGEVANTLPKTGFLFAAALLALLAVPPSPLFLSEYIIVAHGIIAHPWATGILLLSITVVAAAFIRSLVPLLYAPASQPEHEVQAGEALSLSHAAVGLHILALVALGVIIWTTAGSAFFISIAQSIGA